MTQARVWIRLAALTLAIVFTGCASGVADHCPGGGTRAVGESLYFGTTTPVGTVSPEQWEAFVAHEITPRFPKGLTSWRAKGQWLSESGELQREESFVLYVVHPDTPESDAAVRAIIDRYRAEFRQDAVLRVRSSVCVSL